MPRASRTPLRDRIPRDINGIHHNVEGDPATIERRATPRKALSGTIVQPAPVSAAYQRIEADRLWAEQMARSGMLPEAYRNKPQNVIWAIGYARALNIPTMMALNEVYLSKSGKPAMTTQLMAALVRRAGHKLRVKVTQPENNPLRGMYAIAQVIRHDDPEYTFEPPPWNLDRAIRANLVQVVDNKLWARSQGGKIMPWEVYPEAMLKSRALSEVLRESCQDVLIGVVYTPEELGALVDSEGRPVDLGADGEGFDSYDLDLNGFDGPSVNPDDLDADNPMQDTPEPQDDPSPEQEEGQHTIPDDAPRKDTFDPATSPVSRWEAELSEASQNGDRNALNRLYLEAGRHRSEDEELLAAFHRFQDKMNPNPF